MSLTDLVPVPAGINAGLNGTGNALILSLLGNPRSSYDQECREVTNSRLKQRIETDSVGPFRATGFDLAIASLKEVMADIKAEQRQVFDSLSTAGMLCCRRVRGSTTSISNHSWGTAIDLKIDGQLDPRGDGKVQRGLTLIAPIFNRHGWYWGAGFRIEDGMHFEVSRQKMQQWQQAGKLFSGMRMAETEILSLGDRSEAVTDLQQRLNRLGEDLATDGIFGPDTHAAVVAFQAGNDLVPDGIVGRRTWDKLKSAT